MKDFRCVKEKKNFKMDSCALYVVGAIFLAMSICWENGMTIKGLVNINCIYGFYIIFRFRNASYMGFLDFVKYSIIITPLSFLYGKILENYLNNIYLYYIGIPTFFLLIFLFDVIVFSYFDVSRFNKNVCYNN